MEYLAPPREEPSEVYSYVNDGDAGAAHRDGSSPIQENSYSSYDYFGVDSNSQSSPAESIASIPVAVTLEDYYGADLDNAAMTHNMGKKDQLLSPVVQIIDSRPDFDSICKTPRRRRSGLSSRPGASGMTRKEEDDLAALFNSFKDFDFGKYGNDSRPNSVTNRTEGVNSVTHRLPTRERGSFSFGIETYLHCGQLGFGRQPSFRRLEPSAETSISVKRPYFTMPVSDDYAAAASQCSPTHSSGVGRRGSGSLRHTPAGGAAANAVRSKAAAAAAAAATGGGSNIDGNSAIMGDSYKTWMDNFTSTPCNLQKGKGRFASNPNVSTEATPVAAGDGGANDYKREVDYLMRNIIGIDVDGLPTKARRTTSDSTRLPVEVSLKPKLKVEPIQVKGPHPHGLSDTTIKEQDEGEGDYALEIMPPWTPVHKPGSPKRYSHPFAGGTPMRIPVTPTNAAGGAKAFIGKPVRTPVGTATRFGAPRVSIVDTSPPTPPIQKLRPTLLRPTSQNQKQSQWDCAIIEDDSGFLNNRSISHNTTHPLAVLTSAAAGGASKKPPKVLSSVLEHHKGGKHVGIYIASPDPEYDAFFNDEQQNSEFDWADDEEGGKTEGEGGATKRKRNAQMAQGQQQVIYGSAPTSLQPVRVDKKSTQQTRLGNSILEKGKTPARVSPPTVSRKDEFLMSMEYPSAEGLLSFGMPVNTGPSPFFPVSAPLIVGKLRSPSRVGAVGTTAAGTSTKATLATAAAAAVVVASAPRGSFTAGHPAMTSKITEGTNDATTAAPAHLSTTSRARRWGEFAIGDYWIPGGASFYKSHSNTEMISNESASSRIKSPGHAEDTLELQAKRAALEERDRAIRRANEERKERVRSFMARRKAEKLAQALAAEEERVRRQQQQQLQAQARRRSSLGSSGVKKTKKAASSVAAAGEEEARRRTVKPTSSTERNAKAVSVAPFLNDAGPLCTSVGEATTLQPVGRQPTTNSVSSAAGSNGAQRSRKENTIRSVVVYTSTTVVDVDHRGSVDISLKDQNVLEVRHGREMPRFFNVDEYILFNTSPQTLTGTPAHASSSSGSRKSLDTAIGGAATMKRLSSLTLHALKRKFRSGMNTALLLSSTDSAKPASMSAVHEVIEGIFHHLPPSSELYMAVAQVQGNLAADLQAKPVQFFPAVYSASPFVGMSLDKIVYTQVTRHAQLTSLIAEAYSNNADLKVSSEDGSHNNNRFSSNVAASGTGNHQGGSVLSSVIVFSVVLVQPKPDDVLISSLLLSDAGSNHNVYQQILQKADNAPHQLFQSALGGPCFTVAMCAVGATDTGAVQMLNTQHKLATISNKPNLLGSVQRFRELLNRELKPDSSSFTSLPSAQEGSRQKRLLELRAKADAILANKTAVGAFETVHGSFIDDFGLGVRATRRPSSMRKTSRQQSHSDKSSAGKNSSFSPSVISGRGKRSLHHHRRHGSVGSSGSKREGGGGKGNRKGQAGGGRQLENSSQGSSTVSNLNATASTQPATTMTSPLSVKHLTLISPSSLPPSVNPAVSLSGVQGPSGERGGGVHAAANSNRTKLQSLSSKDSAAAMNTDSYAQRGHAAAGAAFVRPVQFLNLEMGADGNKSVSSTSAAGSGGGGFIKHQSGSAVSVIPGAPTAIGFDGPAWPSDQQLQRPATIIMPPPVVCPDGSLSGAVGGAGGKQPPQQRATMGSKAGAAGTTATPVAALAGEDNFIITVDSISDFSSSDRESNYAEAEGRGAAAAASEFGGRAANGIPASTKVRTLVIVDPMCSETSNVTYDNTMVIATTEDDFEEYDVDEVTEVTCGAVETQSDVLKELCNTVLMGCNAAILGADSRSSYFSPLVLKSVVHAILGEISSSNKTSGKSGNLIASIVQLKGETVTDLLTPHSEPQKLVIAISPIFGSCVHGVTYSHVDSPAAFDTMITTALTRATGERNRDYGLVFCSLILKLKLKEEEDVLVCSLVASFAGENVGLYNAVLERSLLVPRALYHYALGGPCYTVALLGIGSDEARANQMLLVQKRLGEITNRPTHPGSIVKFIMGIRTDLAPTLMQKLESTSDPIEQANTKEILERLAEMVRDAEALLRDFDHHEPKAYLHSDASSVPQGGEESPPGVRAKRLSNGAGTPRPLPSSEDTLRASNSTQRRRRSLPAAALKLGAPTSATPTVEDPYPIRSLVCFEQRLMGGGKAVVQGSTVLVGTDTGGMRFDSDEVITRSGTNHFLESRVIDELVRMFLTGHCTGLLAADSSNCAFTPLILRKIAYQVLHGMNADNSSLGTVLSGTGQPQSHRPTGILGELQVSMCLIKDGITADLLPVEPDADYHNFAVEQSPLFGPHIVGVTTHVVNDPTDFDQFLAVAIDNADPALQTADPGVMAVTLYLTQRVAGSHSSSDNDGDGDVLVSSMTCTAVFDAIQHYTRALIGDYNEPLGLFRNILEAPAHTVAMVGICDEDERPSDMLHVLSDISRVSNRTPHPNSIARHIRDLREGILKLRERCATASSEDEKAYITARVAVAERVLHDAEVLMRYRASTPQRGTFVPLGAHRVLSQNATR